MTKKTKMCSLYKNIYGCCISLSLLFALLSGIFWYGLHPQAYTSIQVHLFLDINHMLSKAGSTFWLNVTALGDALLLIPMVSFLLLRNTRAWAALFGAIPLSTLLCRGAKALFEMPRPCAVIDVDKINIIGKTLYGSTSLPSGHTVTIFAIVSVLIILLFYGDQKSKHPVIWGVGLLMLGLLVALSRIAVGAHWPLDVTLGAIFGAMGGLSGVMLTYKYKVWWHWMTQAKSKYIHIGFLLLLSIAMIVEYAHLILAWLAMFVAGWVIYQLLKQRETNP